MTSITKRATKLTLWVTFGLMALTVIPASAQATVFFSYGPQAGPPGTVLQFVVGNCPRGAGATDGVLEVHSGPNVSSTVLSSTPFTSGAGGSFVGSTAPLPSSTVGLKAVRLRCTSSGASSDGAPFAMGAGPGPTSTTSSTSSTTTVPGSTTSSSSTSSTSSTSTTSTTSSSTTTSTTIPPPTTGGGGSRIGVINSCLGAHVKEGFLTNGFSQQLNCGDARAIALADTRVGVVNSCGAYYVKQGALNSSFNQQTQCNDASAIAVSANRNGVISGCGAAHVKEGVLTNGFNQQLNCGDARAVSLNGTT